MASWLIDYEPAINSFFDEQEAAIELDNGCYGQFGDGVYVGR
jgi:hypothetical protein